MQKLDMMHVVLCNYVGMDVFMFIHRSPGIQCYTKLWINEQDDLFSLEIVIYVLA